MSDWSSDVCSSDLIRVLDEHGKAIGEWAPTLSAATLHKGLRAMMLTRAFDERMQRAQRQGKTSFYIKSTGEEAVAVAQALALDAGALLVPGYRQQGLLITRSEERRVGEERVSTCRSRGW